MFEMVEVVLNPGPFDRKPDALPHDHRTPFDCTFDAEALVIHKNEERLLERMEMRMLRWIAGISLERRHKEGDGCVVYNR